MNNMRISVLYAGRMDFLKKHLMDCGNDTEMICCLVPALLIQHPTLGNILFDTGNSADSAHVYPHAIADNFPVTDFVSIEDALAEKGLTPADIDILILSHLHFDHAGGLQYFKGTKAIKNVYIAADELKNAFYCAMTGDEKAYCRTTFNLDDILFHAIDGNTSLADEITLIPQRCHTPGVIGLLLKTKNNGNIFATSDTVYTRESFEKELPPGGDNIASQKDFFENLKVIRGIQKKYDATLFFGHDEAQITEWTKKGWID